MSLMQRWSVFFSALFWFELKMKHDSVFKKSKYFIVISGSIQYFNFNVFLSKRNVVFFTNVIIIEPLKIASAIICRRYFWSF